MDLERGAEIRVKDHPTQSSEWDGFTSTLKASFSVERSWFRCRILSADIREATISACLLFKSSSQLHNGTKSPSFAFAKWKAPRNRAYQNDSFQEEMLHYLSLSAMSSLSCNLSSSISTSWARVLPDFSGVLLRRRASSASLCTSFWVSWSTPTFSTSAPAKILMNEWKLMVEAREIMKIETYSVIRDVQFHSK